MSDKYWINFSFQQLWSDLLNFPQVGASAQLNHEALDFQ